VTGSNPALQSSVTAGRRTAHQIVHHIGFVYVLPGVTYEHDRQHVKPFLILYSWMADYVFHLAHYMFVAGCRFDNVDHFINFIGVEASVDPSATPPLDIGDVVTSHDVVPLFTSILSSLTTGRIVAFIRCAMGARCRCNYELLYHFRKNFLGFMLSLHERNQIKHPARE